MGGWPRGRVVKFARSTSAARGSPVQILGADMALIIKPRCGSIPHRRTRMTYKWDIQLCTEALGEKKRGRLATDLSSGPIFLTKKEKSILLKKVHIFKKKKEERFDAAFRWQIKREGGQSQWDRNGVVINADMEEPPSVIQQILLGTDWVVSIGPGLGTQQQVESNMPTLVELVF